MDAEAETTDRTCAVHKVVFMLLSDSDNFKKKLKKQCIDNNSVIFNFNNTGCCVPSSGDRLQVQSNHDCLTGVPKH